MTCSTDPSGHFFFQSTCVKCGEKLPSCMNCARGWKDTDSVIHCGAAFEDNPIWATRKYSEAGLFAMAANNGQMTPGMDCENMAWEDGRDCPAFEMKS